MSLRHLLSLVVGLLVFAGGASAAVAKDGHHGGFILTVPHAVQAQSGYVTVDFEVTNNTDNTASCNIYVEEIDFNIPIAPIGAGQTAGGQIATPYTGMKRLTFTLNCDGAAVAREKVKIFN